MCDCMQHSNSGVSREERRGENERGRALLAMSKLGRLCFAYTDSLSNENENMRLCLSKRLHTHTAKEVRIVSASVCVRACAYCIPLSLSTPGQVRQTKTPRRNRQTPVTVRFCNFLSRRLTLPARPTVHIGVQGPTYNLSSSQVGRTSAIIT